MKILFYIFIFLILFNLFFTNDILASENFKADLKMEYVFDSSGTAHVVNEIKIENLTSQLYAKSIQFSLKDVNPINIKIHDKYSNLNYLKTINDQEINFDIKFKDTNVGKSNKFEFFIEFDEESLAKKKGDVWEIDIPKLDKENIFEINEIKLTVPNTFGNESFISPKPDKSITNDNNKTYIFLDNKLLIRGVNANFGQFQIYSFSITYHLENELNRKDNINIAIPPDTSYQKIYYQNIEPKPNNIKVEEDGNWIADFSLKPKERLDVFLNGFVHIYSTPFDNQYHKIITPTIIQLENNKKSTKYWQANDESIQKITKEKNNVKEIYDFVTTTLKYDYERVKPDIERKGAKEALLTPDSSICTEFTDLFIAITRSAGIPAREINGFAYTTNLRIQPLSLVSDVLHAWPEYWDFEKQLWIALDPTWESTTGGIDYFNNFDLNHFAFVIHGKNDSYPKPPGTYKLEGNPQKDIFVTIGKSENIDLSKISLTFEKIKNNFYKNTVTLKINNFSNFAIYDLQPEIYIADNHYFGEKINVLPPFSQNEYVVHIPKNIFTLKTPIIIKIDDQEIILKFNYSESILNISVVIFILLLSLLILNKIKNRLFINKDFKKV